MVLFKKIAPEPVAPDDGERAKQFLQQTTNFDIDEFLADHTVEQLFNTPLGPTKHCLNVDQVADAAAARLTGFAKEHLTACSDCFEQVRTYQTLEETDFTDATRGVDILNFIRVPPGKSLYLVLYNRGEVTLLSDIDPESVEVSGAIDGTVKSIDLIDPKPYKANEAVAVHFEKFTLNVPESGEVEDYLCFGAKTTAGRFLKRSKVHIIDEAKVQSSGAAMGFSG